MLVRTTDQLGRIAVGFSQPHPFGYRLVVPAVPGATGGVSGPLIR